MSIYKIIGIITLLLLFFLGTILFINKDDNFINSGYFSMFQKLPVKITNNQDISTNLSNTNSNLSKSVNENSKRSIYEIDISSYDENLVMDLFKENGYRESYSTDFRFSLGTNYFTDNFKPFLYYFKNSSNIDPILDLDKNKMVFKYNATKNFREYTSPINIVNSFLLPKEEYTISFNIKHNERDFTQETYNIESVNILDFSSYKLSLNIAEDDLDFGYESRTYDDGSSISNLLGKDGNIYNISINMFTEDSYKISLLDSQNNNVYSEILYKDNNLSYFAKEFLVNRVFIIFYDNYDFINEDEDFVERYGQFKMCKKSRYCVSFNILKPRILDPKYTINLNYSFDYESLEQNIIIPINIDELYKTHNIILVKKNDTLSFYLNGVLLKVVPFNFFKKDRINESLSRIGSPNGFVYYEINDYYWEYSISNFKYYDVGMYPYTVYSLYERDREK